jgi:signal transduction histidine kinase
MCVPSRRIFINGLKALIDIRRISERVRLRGRLTADREAHRSTLLAFLCSGFALIVVCLLALEAWRSTDGRQDAVRAELRGYARIAGLQFRADVVEGWRATAIALFAPLGGQSSARASNRTFSVSDLEQIARDASACHRTWTPEQSYFFSCMWDPRPLFYMSYEPGRQKLRIDGAEQPANSLELRQALANSFDAMPMTAATLTRGNYFTLAGTTRDSTFYWLMLTAVRGVEGAPNMVYGFAVDPERFEREVYPLLLKRPLLPPPLAHAPAESLIVLSVRSPAGSAGAREGSRAQFHSSGASDGVAEDSTPIWDGGDSPLVHVSMRPRAVRLVERQPAGEPRPVDLLLLTGLAAALLVAAFALAHRTSALARLRASFVSNVSHELRTPVAEVLATAETLALGRFHSEAEHARALQTIVRESRRLAVLIDNVLLRDRVERGASQLAREHVELNELIAEIVDGYRPLAVKRGVALCFVAPGGVTDAPAHLAGARTLIQPASIIAYVDAGAFRHMLLNLLDNAVKFSPREGTVVVGVSRSASSVQCWVDDGGPGIPMAERTRIWEPFVQGRHADSMTTGSGLGLFIVRHLVQLHGGRSWIEDSPLGGARVIMQFPPEVPATQDSEKAGANRMAMHEMSRLSLPRESPRVRWTRRRRDA